jgi:hypothetical protein
MMRLILTTTDTGAGALRGTGIADVVIGFDFRFVWGRLPLQAELASFLDGRSAEHDSVGAHWLDSLNRRQLGEIGDEYPGLAEFCDGFEKIELWVDPRPNDQLILVWLLDFLRSHQEIVSKLSLVQADDIIGGYRPESLAKWKLPALQISDDRLRLAGRAWDAYRSRTPEACSDLLSEDLTGLPQLRPAIGALLEELPGRVSGLGATERRMVELVSQGYMNPIGLFPHHAHQPHKVFGYWEAGSLLEGLARCPAPVISGLGEGPFTEEIHSLKDRHDLYKQSRLSLTDLGKAVLAGKGDFGRHNPIHRWWGGTELTNERLWRWDRGSRALVAP